MLDEVVKLANGPSAIKVSDDKLLKNVILSQWQIIDLDTFFPAPQPVSLERRDIVKLINYEYMICPKSDGMRFLLLCYDGLSYMVDRAFKFYKIKLSVSDELYNRPNVVGGIFDGELIQNKQGHWQYVIHDCINIHGQNISGYIFPARQAEVDNMVNSYWIPNPEEIMLVHKQFYPLKHLRLLNGVIMDNKLDHTVDGLIFTPKNKKIGSFTQYDLFKWKPQHLHTFDFKITKGHEGITAYANKNGVHVAYASASHGSTEEKIFIEELMKNCPEFTNNSIVECAYDSIRDMYIPIKLRLDKTHPNSLFTIKKTLCNITEDITIDELIALVENK